MKIYTLIIILVALSLSSFGQSFNTEIDRVFDFYPHKMTAEEQEAVYPKLDTLFDTVENDKEKYLPLLREELKSVNHNPYFYFDGGILLLLISKEKQDFQIAADALTKCDIKDLPYKVYLERLLYLSLNGADVIDASFVILNDTAFQVYIPQHALLLNYGEALQFILPRYQSDLYIDKLISEFEQIPTVEKKLSCIALFVYANNCKADKYLEKLRDDLTQSEKIRVAAKKTLENISVNDKNNERKFEKYFNIRKKKLNRISDEAIYELDDLTMKMRKVYKCE